MIRSYSRRSLLAALWSIVGFLTVTAFLIAFIFAIVSSKYEDNEDGGDSQSANQMQGIGGVTVTSRAMGFAAIWTAVLSGIIVIYGTVILGIQSPTGKYYACCTGNVHRMTPLSLGAFSGSLFMFANLTLVCAILFGEFEMRDFYMNQNNNNQNNSSNIVDHTSFAFSIMCIFFTIMYASFAAVVFANANILLEESVADAREEISKSSEAAMHNNAPGYIGGDRFGVSRSYGKGTSSIEVV